jgi:hypothetical protein
MKDLFNNLVKIGNQNPELRDNISPILHHLNQRSKSASVDNPRTPMGGILSKYLDVRVKSELGATIEDQIGGSSSYGLEGSFSKGGGREFSQFKVSINPRKNECVVMGGMDEEGNKHRTSFEVTMNHSPADVGDKVTRFLNDLPMGTRL